MTSSDAQAGRSLSSTEGTSMSGDCHEFVHEYSAESPYCGALVMRNGGGETCGRRREDPAHMAPRLGHATTRQLLAEIDARVSNTLVEPEPLRAVRRLYDALAAVPGALDYSTVNP